MYFFAYFYLEITNYISGMILWSQIKFENIISLYTSLNKNKEKKIVEIFFLTKKVEQCK